MNMVDLIVILVILLSAVLALMRGFVSEVLSVGGWVGAVIATIYALPQLQPYMRAHVSPEMLADGMVIAGVFILTLAVLSVIAHEVSKSVRDSALGALDRSLGLMFGVARGALLVCLAWMTAVWLMPDREKDQPAWLREAKTRPLAETGAAWLRSIVPSHVRDDAVSKADAALAKARQTYQDADALRRMTTAKPDAAASNAKPDAAKPDAAKPDATSPAGPNGKQTSGGVTGDPPDNTRYNKKDRGELERLFKNAN